MQVESEQNNIFNDAIAALQSRGEIAIEDVRNSILGPIEQAIKKAIFQTLLFLVIAFSFAYLCIFTLFEIFTTIGLQSYYIGPVIAGIFLALGLFLMGVIKKKSSIHDGSERINDLKSIAKFNADMDAFQRKIKFYLNNPKIFFKDKFFDLRHSFRNLSIFSNQNIFFFVMISLFCGYLFRKLTLSDKKSVTNLGQKQESKFSKISDPIKGFLIASLTNWAKDYTIQALKEMNRSKQLSKKNKSKAVMVNTEFPVQTSALH